MRIHKQIEDSVRLIGAYFEIETTDPEDKGKIKKLLKDWYRNHARSIVAGRFQMCFDAVSFLKPPLPDLKFKKMNKRWGSFSKSGSVIINPEIIKTPLKCIDYVLIHELCHLKFSRHDDKFYRLLGRIIPDWERRKKQLESIGAQAGIGDG